MILLIMARLLKDTDKGVFLYELAKFVPLKIGVNKWIGQVTDTLSRAV